jgi:hypothetical protein
MRIPRLFGLTGTVLSLAAACAALAGEVRLAREDVVVMIGKEAAEVSAVVELVNDGPAAVVTLRHPLPPGSLEYVGKGGDLQPADLKTDFAVKDGDAVVSYELADCVWVYEQGEVVIATAVWRLKLQAGECRRLEYRYTQRYRGGGMELDHHLECAPGLNGGWPGTVEKGTVAVERGAGFDWSTPTYYLAAGIPPARDDGAAIVWAFENLDPSAEAALNAPRDGEYYRYAGLDFAGVRVGFIGPDVTEEGYAHSSYRVPPGPGAPAGVLVDGLNFRTEPSADAPRVEGKPAFARGEGMVVHERRGEWYRVEAHGGHAGWVRWRYVDPDTGREHIYVELALTCE